MKYFVSFRFYEWDEKIKRSDPQDDLPASVYNQMASRWPEFRPIGLHGIHVRAEVGSPLLEEVFAFLASHGRKPWWIRFPRNKSENVFLLRGERIFEPQDLIGAELVTLGFRQEISEFVMYHGDCDVWLDGSRIDPDILFGGGGACNLPIVTEGVKAQIEAAGWRGLTFRPVEIRDANPDQGKLWLMWPDHEMPPMLNEVVDSAGRPFDPEVSDQCYVQDIFTPWLFRYTKSDLILPEGCCAFRTHERFGTNKAYWGRPTRKPDIITRVEFGEWLKSKGWVEELHPVKLE